MPGFNPAATNTWTVATAAAGFTNFTATAFSVSTAAFSNAFTGTFSVATNGNTLQVVYTPAAVSLTAPVLGTASAYAGGAFSLQFSGVSGQTYHVLETMNLLVPLTNWLVLTNGTFGPGAVNYTNWSATNAAQFYRIKSP